MTKRVKVPRASIACTILDDPDYIGLMLVPEGRDAFALFCSLLTGAKAQGNMGVFEHPHAVTATMLRWPLDAYASALDTLTRRTNWVSCVGQVVMIRSFKKWNNWGGVRDLDTPQDDPKSAPSANQDWNDEGQNGAIPASASASASGTTKTTTVVELPTELLPYQTAVDDWLAYKRERGQTYKPRGLKALYTSMIELGAGLPGAVQHSMTNNYAGLFTANKGGGAVASSRQFALRAEQGDKYRDLGN